MQLPSAVPACALLLALSACSGSSTPTALDSPSPAPLSTTAAPVPSPTPSPEPSAATTAGPSASPTPRPSASSTSAGAPRCATGRLALSVGQSGAAAGTSYTPLVLRNAGTTTCHLTGFPGVSFLDRDGRQVGRPADMTALARQTVVLAPGRSAYAQLGLSNTGAYDPAACRPAPFTQVRVYPPGDRVALVAPFEGSVCTTSVQVARVDPVRPGDGADA